ncbi:hypothetical protein PFISCL1PPCAC_19767, partial [Pristionchus fissidentatus]
FFSMTDQWKSAYKTIYGKSPGKADYTLAPCNVSKESIKRREEENEREEKSRNLFAPTRLKRPAQFSPVKQMVKRRAIQPIKEENVLTPVRESPRKKEKTVGTPVRESPRKKVITASSLASSLVKKSLFAPIPGNICFTSPTKPLSVNREMGVNRLPNGANPSPRKPLIRTKLKISCADALYETKSPMKKSETTRKDNEIPFEELQAENEEAKKDARPRAYRKPKDTNFLKLNMKKGYHAKGKLTAEQKRKFKRKSNYKRFKAGQ